MSALLALLCCLAPVAGVAGAAGLTAAPGPVDATASDVATQDTTTHGATIRGATTHDGRSLADSPSPQAAVAQQADEPAIDGTTIIIRVQENGDARVSVIYAYRLHGRNESQAFDERIGPQFENGTYDSYDDDLFRQVVERSDAVNNRSMAVEEVARNAYTLENPRLDTTTGYLALNFTWTNFAVRQGNAIRVGSAFNASVDNSSETGTWLPRLREDQTLIIVPPKGYRVDSAIGTNGVLPGAIVRWDGPASFYPGQVEITYERNPTVSPVSPTPPPDGIPWIPILAVVIVLLTLIALGAYTFSRDGGAPGPAGSASPNGGVDDGGDGGTPAGGSDAASATAASAAATDDGAETADGEEVVDPDLLSDEERVERMLERNGGRMKQANIVRETGWSNAKVSQLLSSMDENGRVDKLRIGRENLISLPGEDDY